MEEFLTNKDLFKDLFKDENVNGFILSDERYKELKDYITNLQQKVDLYENPDDMTLFYMWLDEKSKDKMKQLQQENNRLKSQQKEIERLNNIINELEKYIDDNYFYDDVGMKIFDVSLLEDKLKELKESSNNE